MEKSTLNTEIIKQKMEKNCLSPWKLTFEKTFFRRRSPIFQLEKHPLSTPARMGKYIPIPRVQNWKVRHFYETMRI